MNERQGSGRSAILFGLVAVVAGTAALPFLGDIGGIGKSGGVEPTAPAEVLPDDKPEPEKPTITKVAKAKTPAPRKRVKTWNGGGESVALGGKGSSGSGGTGSGWQCPKCKREVSRGGKPPAIAFCCGETYYNGKTKGK